MPFTPSFHPLFHLFGLDLLSPLLNVLPSKFLAFLSHLPFLFHSFFPLLLVPVLLLTESLDCLLELFGVVL